MKMAMKILFILVFVHPALCFPSTTLNDRQSETNWQSWLLRDQQSQQNESDGSSVRRITPKSVFIAPNISPEMQLPRCADGYKPDSMGRCIKVVKIDKEAQLLFLLAGLNAMEFENEEDESISVKKKNEGAGEPLQFDIPLTSHKSHHSDIIKSEDKRTASNADASNKNNSVKVQTEEPDYDSTTDETTETTETESTTDWTTTDFTTADLQALFFLTEPTEQNDTTEESDESQITTEKEVDSISLEVPVDSETEIMDQHSASYVKFPDLEDSSTVRHHDTTTYHEKTTHLIPDSNESIRDLLKILNLYQPQVRKPDRTKEDIYNRRNRDKNSYMWRFPSSEHQTQTKPWRFPNNSLRGFRPAYYRSYNYVPKLNINSQNTGYVNR